MQGSGLSGFRYGFWLDSKLGFYSGLLLAVARALTGTIANYGFIRDCFKPGPYSGLFQHKTLSGTNNLKLFDTFVALIRKLSKPRKSRRSLMQKSCAEARLTQRIRAATNLRP